MPPNILDRLRAGEVIIGDGSYSQTLEQRGYVQANIWTPEASIEHPEAVKQLAMEFARAGADITQTYTFYSDDIKLKARLGPEGPTCHQINQSSSNIAKEISRMKSTITAGGISKTDIYKSTKDKTKTVDELKTALKVLIDNDIDMIICEFFRNIEEMEWAIEVAKSYGKPVAATMAIGPNGDEDGVPLGQCAIRMANAGADLVGLNCYFDPFIMLECIKVMKEALDEQDLKPFLMSQPLGFRDPDAGEQGWNSLPEYPYALEPRLITRIEAAKYARAAYNLGIRYIGGCCGFEPYHIRAIAEELKDERGWLPEASAKSELGKDLYICKQRLQNQMQNTTCNPEHYTNKASMDYWKTMNPSTGRPLSKALSVLEDPQCLLKGILK